MARRPRPVISGAALFAREYEVVPVEGGTEFRVRPASTVAGGSIQTRLISAGGGLVLTVMGVGGAVWSASGPMASWQAGLFPLGLFGGLGLFCFGLALLGVPSSHFRLSVRPGGAVWHRGRAVVPGGAVGVWVDCVTEVDVDDGSPLRTAFLYVERADGFTELPWPRFSRLTDFALARALAARLAEALGVPLNDRAPPDPWSGPKRQAAWSSGCAVAMMLVIGVPHFLAGSGVLVGAPSVWWVGAVFTCSGSGLIAGACWQAGWGWRGFGLIVVGLAAVVLAVRFGLAG